MRFTRSFLACVLSALIIAQGSLTSIFTIQDTFASTPSSSGTAGGANPLVVSSGLNKQNVNGLKDLKFSDLFTGWSTYSIPFQFPTGARGTEPGLALSYSSNAKDGLSAYWYGWNLSISAVTRSSRLGTDRIYTLDEFMLDGVEYIPDGTYYRPRFASDATRLERTNDGGWITTDGQGIKRFYGLSASSRLADPDNTNKVFSWSLERILLPTGEHVDYQYERDKGAVYPISVKWAFNTSGNALYEARLVYVPKTRSIASYRTNFPVQTARLLSEVGLYVQGDKKRFYTLQYDATETVDSHLIKVTESTPEGSLPSTQFTYYSGKFAHFLSSVVLPQGAKVDLTYEPSALLKTVSGAQANPKLPMNLMVLTGIKVSEPVVWMVYNRSMTYQDGYFYTDSSDPYRREYAGFGRVKVIEDTGASTVTYFYQGRRDANADRISKKWRSYRTESYSASGVLMALSTQTFTDIPLTNGRVLVEPENSIAFDYGAGWSTYRASAVTNKYDKYGNLTSAIDYGEVIANPTDGSFTDTGSDLLTSNMTYLTDELRNFVAIPTEKAILSNTGVILQKSRTYFDNKPFGEVGEKALGTASAVVNTDNNSEVKTTYEFNTLAQIVSVKDPKWNITQLVPDQYGVFNTKTIDPKGFETLSTYDYALGKAISQTDSNWLQSRMVYDSFGRQKESHIVTSIGEDTMLSSTVYLDTVFPQSVQMTNFVANGQRNTTTYYDGLGRTIQNRTSAFETGKSWVTDTRYNALDLPEFASYPYQTDGFLYVRPVQAFSGVTMLYDGLGRLLTTTDARGISKQEYFPRSRKITDRLGNTKVLNFDIKDQLIEVQEYAGSGSVYSTRYAYNPLGQLTKYTDALGNFRTLKYDGLGRLTELTDLVNSSSSVIPSRRYTYDELGNITQETDQANNTRQYSYDVLGRPIQIIFTRADSVVDRTDRYEYDIGVYAKWRITKESNESYDRSYTYNARGVKSSDTTTIRSGTNTKTYTQSYTYSPTGELTSLVYPDGYTVGYVYRDGFATTLQETTSGSTASQLASILAYTPDAKPSKMSLGAGVITQNTFDPAYGYRLSSIQTTAVNGTKIQDLAYSYDNEDQITQLTESASHAGARKVNYTHDPIGRLTKAQYSTLSNAPLVTENFQSDAIGNLISWPLGTYQYSANSVTWNPHAATQVGGLALAYDTRWNLSSLTEWGVSNNFRYDAAGRMTSVLNSSGSLEYSYKYDSSNTRLLKRDLEENVVTFYPSDNYEESYDKNPANSTLGIPATLETTIDRHVFFAGLRIATRETVLTVATSVPSSNVTSSWATSTASWATSTGATSSGSLGGTSDTGATNSGTTITWSGTSTGEVVQPVVTTDTWTTSSGTISTPTNTWSTDSDAIVPPVVTQSDTTDPITATGSFSGTVNTISLHIAASESSGSTATGTVIPVFPLTAERLVFHFTDHLGSASVDTDANGNILNLHDYLPYGESRIDDTYPVSTEQQVGAKSYKNRYSFGNKERDTESGLRYFEARYYESRIGRFVAQDPVFWELGRTKRANWLILDPQQLNSYSFGRGNPVRFSDPTGECSTENVWEVFDCINPFSLFKVDTAYAPESPEDLERLRNSDWVKWVEEWNTWMDYAGVVSGGIGIVKSWVEFWVKGVVKAEIKQLESWAAKTSLPKAVQNNVDRFVKKAPANSKESLIVEKMSNGNYSATVKSPWKVPGSSAEYKKIIDWKWKTVEMKKTTYSPSWDTIHVKDKLKK